MSLHDCECGRLKADSSQAEEPVRGGFAHASHGRSFFLKSERRSKGKRLVRGELVKEVKSVVCLCLPASERAGLPA